MEVKLTEEFPVDSLTDLVIKNMSSGESENDPIIKPLLIEEIFPYYDFNYTEEEKDVIESVKEFKKKTIELTIEKINKYLPIIYKNWINVTPIEIYIGFKMCCSDPEELICSITKKSFLNKLKIEVEKLKNGENLNKTEEIIEDNTEDDGGEFRIVETIIPQEIRHHKKHQRQEQRKTPKYPKPKEISADTWLSWSDAKQLSYLSSENPNTFYYRNLSPNEIKKTGPWSNEEKKLFLKRLKEMKELTEDGAPQWGIFSQSIPGRVGYQCANFYRKLVSSGEIKDNNYIIDKEGILRYSNKIVHQIKKNNEPILSKYDQLSKENPLNNVIDSITLEIIKVPALAPSGNVLDYNTWINILKDSKVDPFTQKPFTKRQLIILTKENFNEYKNQIKNIF